MCENNGASANCVGIGKLHATLHQLSRYEIFCILYGIGFKKYSVSLRKLVKLA